MTKQEFSDYVFKEIAEKEHLIKTTSKFDFKYEINFSQLTNVPVSYYSSSAPVIAFNVITFHIENLGENGYKFYYTSAKNKRRMFEFTDLIINNIRLIKKIITKNPMTLKYLLSIYDKRFVSKEILTEVFNTRKLYKEDLKLMSMSQKETVGYFLSEFEDINTPTEFYKINKRGYPADGNDESKKRRELAYSNYYYTVYHMEGDPFVTIRTRRYAINGLNRFIMISPNKYLTAYYFQKQVIK